MLQIVIVVLSILLQFLAAALALSLIRVTRQRKAWILIAIALMLMTVRRIDTLIRLLDYPPAGIALETFNILGLVISGLMVLVFLYIRRYFFDVFTSERIVRQSEERYRTLAQHIPDTAVFLFDQNRRLALAEGPLLAQGVFHPQSNGWLAQRLAIPDEEWMALFTPMLDEALRGEEASSQCERQNRTFSIKALPVQEPDGAVMGAIALVRDVTAEIRSEKERAAAYDFLQHTIDGVAEPIMVIDLDYRVTLMNRVVRASYSDPGEPDGALCYRLSHHRDSPCNGVSSPCPLVRVRETLLPVTVMHQHHTASGEARQIEVMASPLLSESGKLLGVIEACRDMTEREQALQTIRKLSQAVEQSPTSIVITDTSGSIEYVNPKFTELTGDTLEDIRGRSPNLLASGHVTPEELARLSEVLRSGRAWKGELESRGRSGEPFWESATLSPVKDARGDVTHVVAVKEDITDRKQAEAKVRESEARYRTISELTSDYTFSATVGADGTIAANWVAGAFENITGYTWDEFIANGAWKSIVHPGDRDLDLADLGRLLANQTISSELRIVKKGGEVRWIHNHVRPVWDAGQGRVVELIGAVKDIHERKQVEATLRESESRHRSISELTSDYTFSSRIEPDGSVVQNWVSGAFERITGYGPEEFAALGGWAGIVYPGDHLQERQDMQALLANHVINNTIRIVTKGGETRWIQRQVRPIWDDGQGRVVAQVGAVRDVTERKLAEQALQESEEKFSKAFWASPLPIAILRLQDRRLLEVNEAFERLSGIRRDQAVGMTEAEIGAWADPDEQERAWQALLSTGRVGPQEYRFRARAGEIQVLRGAAEVVEIHGEPCALVSLVDVTEMREVEEELRKLTRAVEQSSASIMITDAAGVIEYVNPYFTELTGYTTGEAIGQNPRFLKSGQTPPEEFARLWATIRAGEIWRGEFCNKKKNGELYWESASIAPVMDTKGLITHFVAVKEEITQRKRDEEEFHRYTKELEDLASISASMRGAESRSELYAAFLGRLAELFQSGGAAIVMRDRTADRYVCELGALAWKGWTGRALARNLGVDRRVIVHRPSPEVSHLEVGSSELTADMFGSLGHVACVPLIAHGETIGAVWLGRSSAVTESEMRLLDAIGDMAASAIQRQSLLEDLALQLNAVQVAQARLVQSEKLAAIGQLLSGVAHELNNPLTSVVLYSQLVQQERLNPVARGNLDKVVAEALRAGKIVRSLLDFARQRPLDRRVIQVNEVIRDCVDLVTYELKTHKVRLELELDRDLPAVLADKHQLEQVLVNLISNAWQAMSQSSGRGRLRIASECGRSEYTLSPADDRQVVRLRISDDGPGIAPADLSRVFDPFFTTKPEGSGTGLGLPICHGIINEHGGHIWVESELGKGATFFIELPVASEEIELPGPAGQPVGAEALLEECRILILDDEPSIRDVLGQALRRRGYQVDTADNGADGLSLLQQSEYDFILCDIRMPEFSGLDFYRYLKAHNPPLASKVIFITGDTVSSATRKFIEEYGVRHLAKPFELSEVLGLLRSSKGPPDIE